jgi:sec-independent protein translocase protein TatB
MLNIGFTELFIFAVIALLVLGPEKLPEAIRFVFKWYSKIKRTLNNLQNDLDRELRLSELKDQMEVELARIQSLEVQVQEKLNLLEKLSQTELLSQKKAQHHKYHSFQPITPIYTGVYLSTHLNTQIPFNILQYPELQVVT